MSLQSILAQLPPPRRAPRQRRDIKAEIIVLAAIMQGQPLRVAAIAAGVSASAIKSWARRDPQFAQKYEAAAKAGREAFADARRLQLLANG